MGSEKEKEAGATIDAEIWYVYTFDLGNAILKRELNVEGFFEITSLLGLFEPSENSLWVRTESGVKEKTVVWDRGYFPKSIRIADGIDFSSKNHSEKISELITLRKTELTKAFSGFYQEDPGYIRGVMTPILVVLSGESDEDFVLLEPFFRINYDGVFFIEFRLRVKDWNSRRFIKYLNLFEAPIVGGGWPLELAKLNQHFWAVSSGIKFGSREYLKVIETIDDAEVYLEHPEIYPEWKLFPFEFGGIGACFLNDVAENYKYLFVRNLTKSTLSNEKDFGKIFRSSYWQGSTFAVVRDFKNQRYSNTENYTRNKEFITKLFSKNDDYEEKLAPALEENLRLYDDYLLFIDPGFFIKIYNEKGRSKVKIGEGASENLEFMNLDGSTLTIFEYILNLLMGLEIIIDELSDYKNRELGKLVSLKERFNYQKYLLEPSSIPSGEVRAVVERAKRGLWFEEREKAIKEISDELITRGIYYQYKRQNSILIWLTVGIALLGVASLVALLNNINC